MCLRHSIIKILLVLPLGLANPAAADGTAWQTKFDATAGMRYDSNAGISDLDEASGEADSVVLLSGGGSLSFAPAERPFSIRLGYDYSNSSYSRFEQFDFDLHHGVAEITFQNALFDAALALDKYAGILNGEDYVSISQVSPSAARLFGSRVYVRAAWLGSEREYPSLPERNVRTSALRTDVYLLLDSLERYVAIGVQANDESARSRDFEFEGFQVSLAYAHTFETPLASLQLKSSIRYEDRDYAFEHSAIGEPRRDQRWRAGLEAALPFSEHVTLRGKLEQTHNASNLDTATLEKNVAGLELRIMF